MRLSRITFSRQAAAATNSWHNSGSMTSDQPQGRRQIRIGVTTLAWLNIYQNLKQVIQDAIAPEIQSIKGDIKALEAQMSAQRDSLGVVRDGFGTLEARIIGLDRHIGAVETSLKTEIAGLRAEFRSFETRMEKRVEEQGRQWELAMEVRERLAALEAQARRR